MKIPRWMPTAKRCCRRWGVDRNRKLVLLTVFGVLLWGSRSEADQYGVIFPANRFDPEEAGYYQSYVNAGANITEMIDYIQDHHFKAEYWLSIHDPRQASPHRQKVLDGIGLLEERTMEKEEWLKETLPPPAFKKFHESLQVLANQLRTVGDYEELDPALRASFREMNVAKLEMDGRPEQPSESPSPRVKPTLMYRPPLVPIVYNVTTGQWFLSAAMNTPLGSFILSLPPDTSSENIGAGPTLLKIVIADKARYVVLKTGMNVTFKDDELQAVGIERRSKMHVLTLKPIVSSQAKPSTKQSTPPFDPEKDVRRAEPVYPTPPQ